MRYPHSDGHDFVFLMAAILIWWAFNYKNMMGIAP